MRERRGGQAGTKTGRNRAGTGSGSRMLHDRESNEPAVLSPKSLRGWWSVETAEITRLALLALADMIYDASGHADPFGERHQLKNFIEATATYKQSDSP
jgi:hypothetical protein